MRTTNWILLNLHTRGRVAVWELCGVFTGGGGRPGVRRMNKLYKLKPCFRIKEEKKFENQIIDFFGHRSSQESW